MRGAPPAGTASAVEIDFESPPLPDGTVVSTQFAAQGVTFAADPGAGVTDLPVIRAAREVLAAL